LLQLAVDFRAVAGGKDHRFLHLRQLAQRTQHFRDLFAVERELFPDIDRRGLVIDAEREEGHFLRARRLEKRRIRLTQRASGDGCYSAVRVSTRDCMTAARNLAPLLLAGWLAGCAAPLPAPREPLADADYHIFMGELALARGQNHVAVDEYRDAATRLADPAIARRGMMIAVHADDLAAARELVARWAELAPGDAE